MITDTEIMALILERSWQQIARNRPGQAREWYPDEYCGMCGIQPGPENRFNYRSTYEIRLVRDHCHVTGLFRGYLCSPCNNFEGNHNGLHWVAWRLKAPYLAPGKRLMYHSGKSIERWKKPPEFIGDRPMEELLTLEQVFGFRR